MRTERKQRASKDGGVVERDLLTQQAQVERKKREKGGFFRTGTAKEKFEVRGPFVRLPGIRAEHPKILDEKKAGAKEIPFIPSCLSPRREKNNNKSQRFKYRRRRRY